MSYIFIYITIYYIGSRERVMLWTYNLCSMSQNDVPLWWISLLSNQRCGFVRVRFFPLPP